MLAVVAGWFWVARAPAAFKAPFATVYDKLSDCTLIRRCCERISALHSALGDCIRDHVIEKALLGGCCHQRCFLGVTRGAYLHESPNGKLQPLHSDIHMDAYLPSLRMTNAIKKLLFTLLRFCRRQQQGAILQFSANVRRSSACRYPTDVGIQCKLQDTS